MNADAGFTQRYSQSVLPSFQSLFRHLRFLNKWSAMERLEELRKIEEEKLAGLRAKGVIADPPSSLGSYKELLSSLPLKALNCIFI